MKQLLKQGSRKAKIVLLSVALLTVSVMLSGYGSKNFEISKNLDIFSSLFRELIVNYVDDINVSEVMKTGIDEMLQTLDPYTNFIPESDIEDVRFMTTGQYGGIGALIQPRGEFVMIAEPYQGFPAYRAGLMPGDIILEVNGQSVRSRDEEQVRTLLMGQPGTSLSLLISREGEESPRRLSLEREVVRIDNIPYFGMIGQTTAYVKLTGFTRNAGREVRDALTQLQKEHDVESVVIDLRNNGGGLMNEAVNIANLFLEKDREIVRTKGRLQERESTHRTLNDPLEPDIPLAVLINRGSASASEIVAGAIQDYDRGVIIGRRSFGKGLVQNVVPLSYNTQLKVTVAKYYIPSGRSIQSINYAERREDGSVAAIPDTLQLPHQTYGGRVVYDGGGIDPDLKVTQAFPGHLTQALLSQFMIFDYATWFRRQHESIAEAERFEITDEIYQDFQNFISGKDFRYQTRSEELLGRLAEATRDESYYEVLQPELERLRQNIVREKEQDLTNFRPEIEQLLKEEIVSRYYYQMGRVKASLDADPDVAEALRVFADPGLYRGKLAGGK